MNKIKTIGLLALAVVGFSMVHAQTVGAYAAYFSADEVDDAVGGGVLASFPLSQRMMLVVRAAHYPGSEYSSTLGSEIVPVTADVDFTPIDIGLGWEGQLGERSTFLYVDAGFTYLFANGDFMVNEFESDAEFDDGQGWYGAVGVRAGDQTQGFIEVQYRGVETDVSSDESSQITGDLTEIDLDHIAINLGIRMSW